MKDFLKYVSATVVGILVFTIIAGILTMMSLVGMVASGQATKSVKDNSVLVLNLSGQMQEQAEDDIMSMLSYSVSEQPGLQETLNAIKKAKDCEEIKGIYIEAGAFSADFAQLQEIRQALLDFKKSGKWIIAYGDVYTQGTYYLASAADKVYLNPQGEVDWHGLGGQPMFVKDLLQKFGVRFQVVKVGKYKSATEMFTEDKMSDFNRHQTEVYINGLWDNVCKEVGASRKLSVETLNIYADSLIMFSPQEYLISKKMIDGLLYHDQIRGEVKKLLKLEEKDEINQVTIGDMQNVKEKADGDLIAVYLAYGEIVDTESMGLMDGNGHKIVSGPTCKDLEKLMNDDKVKAVVIRVNSPGGSAYASEQIWRQVSLLKEKKPVVISMGGYAASGGYYISCNANWIVAEPTTLTGSIGIFGMIPDFSQLVTQKLGVKFDEVKTNKHSTFGNTLARPMSEEEISYLQRYISRGYSTFRQRVADGRKLSTEQVEEIAQGHVFLGQDALNIKLVDELGGLDVAVAKAAKLAKLDEYYTQTFPEKGNVLEQILEQATGQGTYLDNQMRAMLGIYYEPFMLMKTMNGQAIVQARMPFWINVK